MDHNVIFYFGLALEFLWPQADFCILFWEFYFDRYLFVLKVNIFLFKNRFMATAILFPWENTVEIQFLNQSDLDCFIFGDSNCENQKNYYRLGMIIVSIGLGWNFLSIWIILINTQISSAERYSRVGTERYLWRPYLLGI